MRSRVVRRCRIQCLLYALDFLGRIPITSTLGEMQEPDDEQGENLSAAGLMEKYRWASEILLDEEKKDGKRFMFHQLIGK